MDGRIGLRYSEIRFVEKPARYLGGEFGSRRSWKSEAFHICLFFPDVYEIGVSYYGYQILYHILNRLPGVICERAFLPWVDMQRRLRERRQVLASLETGTPLNEFDVVGITLQTELHYPGLIKGLELSGITRLASERGAKDPVVVGGGPSAYHPEPVAALFDILLLGDGEEALPELAGVLKDSCSLRSNRPRLWQVLTQVKGVYAPGLYQLDDEVWGMPKPVDNAPAEVRSRIALELPPEYYPVLPVVPVVQPEHDRLTVEIMRGCSQGCRFCQAGMLSRPARERPVDELVEQISASLNRAGYDEVGLLSLSTSDYSRIGALLGRLSPQLAQRKTTLAFPSLRPSSFSEEIAGIPTFGRRGNLTFAIEAGSERLRRAINKHITDEDLFAALERSWRYGWQGAKLYLMLGLPTEEDADLALTAELLARLERTAPRRCKLRVSIAVFIPKPHSIFEGGRFIGVEEAHRRRRLITARLQSKRVDVSFHDPRQSMVETICARGDRRMLKVIEAVAEQGEGYETWSAYFDWQRWQSALDEHLPDWQELTNPIPFDTPTPWSHLSCGISQQFRRDELERARRAEWSDDCRTGDCSNCGVIELCLELANQDSDFTVRSASSAGEISAERGGAGMAQSRFYRLTFSKLARMRALGHRDIMREVKLGLRRVGLPLLYSQGLSPRPHLTFCQALPLGVGAVEQWIEFESAVELDTQDWLIRLRWSLPPGLRPLRLEALHISAKAGIQADSFNKEARLDSWVVRNDIHLVHSDLQTQASGMPRGCFADVARRRRWRIKFDKPVEIRGEITAIETIRLTNGGKTAIVELPVEKSIKKWIDEWGELNYALDSQAINSIVSVTLLN